MDKTRETYGSKGSLVKNILKSHWLQWYLDKNHWPFHQKLTIVMVCRRTCIAHNSRHVVNNYFHISEHTQMRRRTNRSATNKTLQSTASLVIPSILSCILVVYLNAVLIHEVIWLLRWLGCPVSEIPIISINPPPFPFVLSVCSSNPEESIAVILFHFWLYVVLDFQVCDWGKVSIVFVAELFSIWPRHRCGLPQVAFVFHHLPVVGT